MYYCLTEEQTKNRAIGIFRYFLSADKAGSLPPKLVELIGRGVLKLSDPEIVKGEHYEHSKHYNEVTVALYEMRKFLQEENPK